jgi:hypothetical protein
MNIYQVVNCICGLSGLLRSKDDKASEGAKVESQKRCRPSKLKSYRIAIDSTSRIVLLS